MRNRLSKHDRGTGRVALLAALAAVLLGCVLPGAASADGPFALSKAAEPYRVCPEAKAGEMECMAIAVPTVSAGSANAVGPDFEGSGELGGFDPKDLRSAYKLPETGGSGQTVAIVDAYNDPYAESDLKKYRETYKLPACTEANGCFKKVNQSGETKNYPENNEVWSGEISLDLDMVSAACPECHILLVEANNNDLHNEHNLEISENVAAVLKATEISDSWDKIEGYEETSEDNKYYNHPGIPITVAAGDEGYGVRYPAASQYVISVGGTELKKEEKGTRKWTEEVWWEPEFHRGTGSGCSAYEPKPKWQTDKPCPRRIDNDVAAVAAVKSPVSVYDSYKTGGWTDLGGTSASAPFVAGMEAISTVHSRSLGAEAFYVAGPKGSLFDVTKGRNGTCTPPAEDEYWCTAEIGYDGPTGWGTPDGPLTLTSAPSVTTGSATGVTETEAKLHGTVNPEGQETKYYFEYGKTTSYGSTTAEASAGSGTSSVEESKTISGLEPDTTYHFRIAATNATGTTHGSDQVFTTEWSILPTPNPAGATGSYLKGTSCTSTAACTAVGVYTNESGKEVTLAERWNGAEWTVQSTPNPSETYNWFNDVSCTSSEACIAVGVTYSAGEIALAEKWNGKEWLAQSLPKPKTPVDSLTGVSCTSATECTAVGVTAGGILAERWNGTEWTIQEAPSPTGATEIYVYDVSCASSNACTLVGSYKNASHNWVPLAEIWNGTKWSVQSAPSPSGAESSYLIGISCTSAEACTSVGEYRTSTGKLLTLAERWNGTEWSIQSTPNPEPKGANHLEDVSCTSSTTCTAVGYFELMPLAERWNSTEWAIQKTPNPAGSLGSRLRGVSCTSSTMCIAAGQYENSSKVNVTLAELY